MIIKTQNLATVFLVDERINTDREIRVIKIDRDLDANGKLIGMEITFGTSNLTENTKLNLIQLLKI